MKNNAIRKATTLSAAFCITASLLTGYAGSEAAVASTGDSAATGAVEVSMEELAKQPPLKISMMLPYGTNEHDNDPLRQRYYDAIEEYTNTEIEWIWYDQSMYDEKLTLVYASGDIPSIMVAKKSAEFINACANGAFWDVTDYVAQFPNLQYMDENARINASINMRLFGVQRSREATRNAFGYRLDWLNNLGMSEPTTIDELYDVLAAFTTQDPNRSGKDDTYGLGVTDYAGTWNIMQVWFGAPNGWGISDKDELVPNFLTPEYNEALKWFRKLYAEGIVNPDFHELPSGEWANLMRSNGGIAGATADTAGNFTRHETFLNDEGVPAEYRVIGYFDGGYGPRTYVNQGYAEILAISTQKCKTENDMLRALYFIDRLSDAEMLNLIEWGYDGEDYYYDSDNDYYIRYTAEEKTAMGLSTIDYRTGLNQLTSYYISPEQNALRLNAAPLTPLKQREADVNADNAKYAIPNYGSPYISETYTKVGADLDKLIADARINYIIGEIDDVGLQEINSQWKRAGGDDILQEMNELYKASQE